MPAQSGVASANLMGPSEGRRERSGTVHTSGTQAHEAATGTPWGARLPKPDGFQTKSINTFPVPPQQPQPPLPLHAGQITAPGSGAAFSGARRSPDCATTPSPPQAGHFASPWHARQVTCGILASIGRPGAFSGKWAAKRDQVATGRADGTTSQRDRGPTRRCLNATWSLCAGAKTRSIEDLKSIFRFLEIGKCSSRSGTSCAEARPRMSMVGKGGSSARKPPDQARTTGCRAKSSTFSLRRVNTVRSTTGKDAGFRRNRRDSRLGFTARTPGKVGWRERRSPARNARSPDGAAAAPPAGRVPPSRRAAQ